MLTKPRRKTMFEADWKNVQVIDVTSKPEEIKQVRVLTSFSQSLS